MPDGPEEMGDYRAVDYVAEMGHATFAYFQMKPTAVFLRPRRAMHILEYDIFEQMTKVEFATSAMGMPRSEPVELHLHGGPPR